MNNGDSAIMMVSMDEVEDFLPADIEKYSEEYFAHFKAWAKKTKTTIYERPEESFSLSEALSIMIEEGNNRLVINNLS